MAVFYAGIAGTDGVPMVNSGVVFAASGGTMDDSNVIQVNWDDATITGNDAKQRLIAGLKHIMQRIENSKEWPVTSST